MVQNSSNSRKTIREWYKYYRERGFIKYVGVNAVKIILAYSLFVLFIYFVGKYLIDYQKIFAYFTENMSDSFVLALFFISESFLGLVPVDLFVL